MDRLKTLFEKFEKFKKYKKETEEIMRKKGLNDYNILSIANKNSDEIMHSKIIASLFDIDGKHYQESLFLEKFLKIIEMKDFINIKNAKIETEKSGENQKDGRIDIYITDGEKHIIIENKINADEQKQQIQRYVKIIYQNNEEISPEDILILYLSKNGKIPSKYSLGNLEIIGDYLKENENKAKFKAISYKKEILNWLNQCISEVENISNLKESLKTYKEIVEKITNKYKYKGVAMNEFLINNLDCIEDVYILHENFPSAMAKVANKFMKELEKYSNLECVNLKIDNQNRVYNLNKLKKWFDKGFKDRKNIASFLKINNKCLLFFWFGDINFHIGIIPYKEDEKIRFDKNNLYIFNKLKTKLKKGNIRDWESLGGRNCCFTINYGNFKENYNPNLVECIKSNDCEIKRDIKKILEFFDENEKL